MSEKPSRPLHSDPQSCKCTEAGTEWCLCWFQWASWDYLLWKMWLHMSHLNMTTTYQNIGCFCSLELGTFITLRIPLSILYIIHKFGTISWVLFSPPYKCIKSAIEPLKTTFNEAPVYSMYCFLKQVVIINTYQHTHRTRLIRTCHSSNFYPSLWWHSSACLLRIILPYPMLNINVTIKMNEILLPCNYYSLEILFSSFECLRLQKWLKQHTSSLGVLHSKSS